jgi:hypothetical protein
MRFEVLTAIIMLKKSRVLAPCRFVGPSLWLAPFPQPLRFRSYISPYFPALSAPEDEDSMFLQNAGIDLQIRTVPKPKTSPNST